MATFNATAADVLRNATIASDHYERRAAATTTFIVPTTTPTLQLEPFTSVSGNTHFVASAGTTGAATSHHHTHQTNSTTSSYTFVQIKREPCQVSEVTTSNNCQHHQQVTTTQQQQQHSGGMSSSSKTTLTTLVKIEASSPKVQDLDKGNIVATPMSNTNNSVPVGIAVARKRQQESGTTITSSSLPIQQPLNKDMNCYGIRVADIGGISSGCSNFYFTGNSDLMTGSTHADDLGISASGVQSINRAPSTFWQYPTVPIESVISMSPATVGLQYPRDPSRGQVVLLPATAAALDPFQQAAAAAFVWPSYIPQGTTTTALQPPHNFIFPSMSPHSSLQASSYTTPLQLLGSNYLTAAAAAAAAAAASSTFCQHNQQQVNSSSSSMSTINLGLGTTNNSNAIGSASSRFLSLAATESKRLQETTLPKQQQLMSLAFPSPTMKVEEWNATEYLATAAAKTLSTTTTLSATTHQNHHIGPPIATLNLEGDKNTIGNFLELQETNSQALNLMRLPTPPTSASIGPDAAQLQPQVLFQANATSPALLNLSASSAAILSRTGNTVSTSMSTNFINNASTTTFAGTLSGPATQLSDEALNFKSGVQETQQFVVGVPRIVGSSAAGSAVGPPPQMQDVNIQTDTPVCSEDENSSCPLAIQNNNIPLTASPASATPPPSENDAHEAEPPLQPLELTMSASFTDERINSEKEAEEMLNSETRCHKSDRVCDSAESAPIKINDLGSITLKAGKVQNIGFKPQAQQTQHEEISATATSLVESITTTSRSLPLQSVPEDLTGLELLSNISTSSFATKTTFSVKQEPDDHTDYQADYSLEPESSMHDESFEQHKSLDLNFQNNPLGNNTLCLANNLSNSDSLLPQAQLSEPLGGLNLLCALAEQRIQEEVQISGSIFNVNTIHDEHQVIFHQQQLSRSFGLDNENSQRADENISQSSIKEIKRKKRKHSQSSKSSKKSASRYVKKNKKKCTREKRKNKQLVSQERGIEFDEDEELKQELKSAFDKVDSSYKHFGKWPNRQEIFDAMESDMRMRLAEITRQYRKKKRKLDEISKNKKQKKRALKMSALNAGLVLNVAAGTASSTTSLSCLGSLNVATTSSNNAHPLSASPLCDYKFSKLLTKSSSTTTGSYLSPSNFLRFSDSKPHTQAQFPPVADVNLNELANTPSCSSSSLYKPLRLEHSSLTAIEGGRITPMRPRKHISSEKSSQLMATPCKERNLMKGRKSNDSSDAASSSKKKSLKSNSFDRELTLTSEHLYRKETRVLTDMGGLFYAGILKPLQPPDVYAITLDGERGNKSHIMSREEIFKDTILEVSPSKIESVPVGTRLCAYWSQQYRCLYPGKAIESEASDDGSKNDFVSVEFDDGDSGRIRLQNIRFLLSDYPIVEYDNQLSSLGKQKRTVMKSGSNSEHTQHPELSSTEDQNLQISNERTEMQKNAMELFAYRSEKKRMKSLKKKSRVNADGSVIGENGRMRKHHKHKKRKKHKKHHHRKTLSEASAAEVVAVNGVSYAADISSIYGSNKQGQPEHEHVHDENSFSNDEELGNECNISESAELSSERNKAPAVINGNFKTESIAPMPDEGNMICVKVKTENLDLEEETTSNMMSEISDEAKVEDDEIEYNNSKGSKIAAFLPERQLWGWHGKAYRKAGIKGRARKQFYKTIKRGKETITVGECAVFLSTGRPDRPYIGRIESMWETASSNKVVRVRWFYHPEETTGCPKLKYPGGLFESPHEDENDVQTISHRCAVLPFISYFAKFGADSKQYQSIYDNNDTYYLSGYYNPRLQSLKLQDDIPIMEDKNS